MRRIPRQDTPHFLFIFTYIQPYFFSYSCKGLRFFLCNFAYLYTLNQHERLLTMEQKIHLKGWFTMLLATYCMISTESICAQKFPQSEDGATVYYKLLSACPDYVGKQLCLQDESRMNKTYAFTLKELDKNSKYQEWVLITANKEKETYHLRNRASYRYISTEASWAGKFKVMGFATKQVTSNALAITDLGNNQVAISYEDEYGKRYLSATNTDEEQPDMPEDLKDSQWAWLIYRADDLANGIHEACTPEVQINVENRHILVSGTTEWDLMDITGMALPQNHEVQPGHIYLVRTKETIYKILVK